MGTSSARLNAALRNARRTAATATAITHAASACHFRFGCRRPSFATPNARESAHSLMILSDHSTSWISVAGVAKVAFFAARSDSKTPRAFEQAVQTWILIPISIVFASVSRNGGHPTGTTASETGLRISDTASPSKNIWTSCPASANALPCRNGNAAFVGSSEPHALLNKTLLKDASKSRESRCGTHRHDRYEARRRGPF